ncbi:MAG: hypothetical protein LBS57_10725 [Treponema sp.]|jgi:hypothetical protein|nr:hypothetical protein [Treponema sp.]
MNDIEPFDSGSCPSNSSLARLGVSAVAFITGGLFLFVLQFLARFRVLGLIFGAVVCVTGIVLLLSKDPEDRKPGALISAAGVLVILSKAGIPLIKAAAGTLLSIGALGFIVMGIRNGIKFFKGLKERS